MDHMNHGERSTYPKDETQPLASKHEGHNIDVLRRKFWVVLLLTIPVLIYSEGIQRLLKYSPPPFPGSDYIPFIFGTFIFLYGGLFFLRGAITELRSHRPGMMTLISLAISVAFTYSLAVTFGLRGEVLYWELSTLVTIMILGHWMEMRAIGSARGAIQELAKLIPDEAERVTDGRVERIPVNELQKDDIVLIRPGSKIPADGDVIQGESSVNEAMITGESRPVHKASTQHVIAGTVNGDGPLRVKITKTGDDTALAGIMRLVIEAQNSRSMAQDLADRAAYWLTLAAIAAGIITFAYWFSTPEPKAFALSRTVTVLVIACPHALGLAIPLVIAISTTLAARNGLLIRDRLSLEMARNLNVVVFDKTGTLTSGEQGLADIYPLGGISDDQALMMMAAAERDSEHMLSRAIVNAASERRLTLPASTDFRAIPGRGVEARIEGHTINVGGPRLLEALQIEVPGELRELTQKASFAGHTLAYLIQDGNVLAAVALADIIRPESREAVRELERLGVKVAMMTGDSEDVARSVADQLGIKEYYANVLPEDKSKRIQEIRKQGRKVAMVGDGVNDAPALVSADVGIAIGAGTDVAIEAGDIVLVRNDPRDIVSIIRLSRASYRKMIENLIWATGYNIVAIPLAAGVLAGYGVILPPAVGAILMSASTVIVALNAQLLRRLRLSRT